MPDEEESVTNDQFVEYIESFENYLKSKGLSDVEIIKHLGSVELFRRIVFEDLH